MSCRKIRMCLIYWILMAVDRSTVFTWGNSVKYILPTRIVLASGNIWHFANASIVYVCNGAQKLSVFLKIHFYFSNAKSSLITLQFNFRIRSVTRAWDDIAVIREFLRKSISLALVLFLRISLLQPRRHIDWCRLFLLHSRFFTFLFCFVFFFFIPKSQLSLRMATRVVQKKKKKERRIFSRSLLSSLAMRNDNLEPLGKFQFRR